MCLWLIRFKYLFRKKPEYLLLLGMFPSIFRTRLNICSYASSALINTHTGTRLGKTDLKIWSSEHTVPQQLDPAWGCAATLLHVPLHPYLLHTPVISHFGKLKKGETRHSVSWSSHTARVASGQSCLNKPQGTKPLWMSLGHPEAI